MYKSLVIAGGALKVMATLGIFKYLEEKNAMKSINTYVGASAGSIMCLFLALGYDSDDIKNMVLESLADPTLSEFSSEAVLEFLTNYGLNDGSGIETLVNKIVKKKTKRENITFIELAKLTGKHLVVCVSNLTKESTEFMSVDTTPNLPVSIAIKASCSIPLMYSPVKIGEDMYLDGGLYNNFPIDFFAGSKMKDILGINIAYKNYQRTDNFLNYVLFMFYSILEKQYQKKNYPEGANIIALEFEDNSDWFDVLSLKIKLTKERLEEYVEMGYARACESIKEKSG